MRGKIFKHSSCNFKASKEMEGDLLWIALEKQIGNEFVWNMM